MIKVILKKITVFLLSASLILGALSGCGGNTEPVESSKPQNIDSSSDNSVSDSASDVENLDNSSLNGTEDIGINAGSDNDAFNSSQIEIIDDMSDSSKDDTFEGTDADDGSPNAEKYKNSKRIEIYPQGKFQFTIVYPEKVLEEDERTIQKTMRLVNRTSSVKTRLYPDNDDSVKDKNDNLILFGATNKEHTQIAHKKLVNRDDARYDDYIITVEKGNIIIYSLSSKGLSNAVTFFNDTFMSENSDHTIPEDYSYIHSDKIETVMSVNGVDIANYIIVTEKYPSRVVMAGMEEVQAAIKEKTGFEIPLVKTNEKLEHKYQIKTAVSGEDYNAYSLTVNENVVNVTGGRIYSLNAALHQFASNIKNVPENKKFNIPNKFNFKGNYDDSSIKNTNSYKLVYSDEFNSNSLNTKDWSTLDYATSTWGAGGGRYSFNVSVKDGMLNLGTSAELKEDGWYYYGSGVNHKVDFQFGYMEIRAKINKGTAIWPSFWLCTTRTADKQFNPEIDVFEFFSTDIACVSQMHSWWNAGSQVNGLLSNEAQNSAGHIEHLNVNKGNTYTLPGNEPFSNDFHTFGCEWTPSYIKFNCDGYVYCTVDLESDLKDSYGAPLNEYMQFLNSDLHIALWSNLADIQTCKPDENTVIPSCYYIDYVHIYQQDGVGYITKPE